MPPRRTFSLSLPPFTKAVKWLILINAAVFLFVTLLKAFGAGPASVLGDVAFAGPGRRAARLDLAAGHLFLSST